MAISQRIPLFLTITLLLGSGCYRNDVQQVLFTIPALTSEECSRIVLSALAKTDGIMEAQPDLEKATLSIRYNARLTALKNIEYAIAESGFDVNEEIGRPEAKARLPEACR
jgi:copper chaperone CopZ